MRGRVLSAGQRWDSRAELNSCLWSAEACRCLPEDRMPEGARGFCQDAKSIGFHKNSGNRRGRLLRPAWHRNPLALSGMLSPGRQQHASAGHCHELSSAMLSQQPPQIKLRPLFEYKNMK
ncbi:hypothetical protein CRENBAI_011531 [Crenichthys baileyi]|uniref:Uncharacterized protein n=1 Tax=Crenichthys baileyi TaxID=28760 RepID=A0AAV9QT85_9TELE